MAKKLHLICNAHLDPVWQWEWEEGAAETLSTFRIAADFCAEYVTNPGPLDEDALRRYFKGVCQAASGCLFEMAQREVGTIFGDFARGKRYVQIARECIAEYWKP